MSITRDWDCSVLAGRKFNSCISILEWSGELLGCLCQPFAVLLEWGWWSRQWSSLPGWHGTGLLVRIQPCSLSVWLFPHSEICAVPICSKELQLSSHNPVCQRQPDLWAVQDHAEVPGLTWSCRMWCPVLQPSALAPSTAMWPHMPDVAPWLVPT